MSKNKLSLLGVTLLLGSTIIFSSLFIKPMNGVQNYTYKGIKTQPLNHSLNNRPNVINFKGWNGI